jgi:hypothetical protein
MTQWAKWAAIAVGLVFSTQAGATTLLKTDLQELSSTSDVVVRGTVKRVESRWTKDGSRIVTDIDVEVREAMKGAPPKTVTIRQPGGVVGDIGQKVSGLASFQEGEDVVVFLEKKPGNAFDVRGWAQGKYKIAKGADGKALMAIPERVEETMLLDPQTRKPVAPNVEPIQLDALRAQVKASLKLQSRPPSPLKKAP